ncbi:MAG: hypothetical protein HRU20_30345 [Pseudomonadales bacterium]|nr:hypothetical protein [Pseudomonadales bacterium]
MSELASNIGVQEKPTSELLFVGYILAILVDLTVLNLFDEYWHLVSIDSFSISLLAAILMQLLLKSAIAVEHKVADYFNKKQGVGAKVLRGVSAYIILVGSKFLILEIINVIFDDRVSFTGPWQGAIAFIVVIAGMLAVEFIVGRIYRQLKDT